MFSEHSSRSSGSWIRQAGVELTPRSSCVAGVVIVVHLVQPIEEGKCCHEVPAWHAVLVGVEARALFIGQVHSLLVKRAADVPAQCLGRSHRLHAVEAHQISLHIFSANLCREAMTSA